MSDLTLEAHGGHAMTKLPQSPQQREDDGPDTRIRNRGADRPVRDLDVAPNVAPAPSSTVEPHQFVNRVERKEYCPKCHRSYITHEFMELGCPACEPSPDEANFSKRKSEDAGLVERLRHIDSLSPVKSIFGAAAAALEAKDADKAQGIAMINELASQCNEAQAEIERWALRYSEDMAAAHNEIERCEEEIKDLFEQRTRLREALEKTQQSIARAALKGGNGSE
jgi:hypothetical protein